MDKPAKRLTRMRQIRVRVSIGAICTRYTCEATFSALETIKLSDESLESYAQYLKLNLVLYKLLNHLNSEFQISELI